MRIAMLGAVMCMAAMLGCHTRSFSAMQPKIEHTGILHVRGTCNTHERIDQELRTSWTVNEKGLLFSQGEWMCNPIQLTVTAKKSSMSKTDCPERSRDGGMTLLERVEGGEIVSIGDGQYKVSMSTNMVGVRQPVTSAAVCALEYDGVMSGP